MLESLFLLILLGIEMVVGVEEKGDCFKSGGENVFFGFYHGLKGES